MPSGGDPGGTSVVDRVVGHAATTALAGPDLEATLRAYFEHVDEADLAERHVGDLFGMAADHLQLASSWEPDTIAIDVTDPRIEVDGWECDHTVVRIVTADMPFLVDSVSMALNQRAIGIHLVMHPVMARRASDGSFVHARDADAADQLVSLIAIEIDRQADADDREAVEDGLRQVLADVKPRCATGGRCANAWPRSRPGSPPPTCRSTTTRSARHATCSTGSVRITSSSSAPATTPSARRMARRCCTSCLTRASASSPATFTSGGHDRCRSSRRRRELGSTSSDC